MAKAVRWQIPFVSSIEKTQYRIDIYDEQDGTWSGVTTLTGGPSPIVTDEDASDDFFAPIRTQTGNIEVCTAIPGGGTLSLEDILPENNIARPVRLVSIAADMSEKIEWQGFLSCQAYNQAYTDIPEIIQLPINSVLEAMDSVPVSTDRIGGVMSISSLVYHILKEIRIQCDLPCFTHINYSADDFSIFTQFIDSTVLFELKEYNLENTTTYIVDGMSCKEALTRICTFMGWVAREMKTDVVLERLCSDLGMYREDIEDFYGNFHYSVSYNSPLKTGLSIFDPYWRGTDHQQSIMQGAKSVEVVANLESYETSFDLPECPDYTLSEYTGRFTGLLFAAYVCKDDQYYASICQFNYYLASLSDIDKYKKIQSCTLDDVVSGCALNSAITTTQEDGVKYIKRYMGAFFALIGTCNNDGELTVSDIDSYQSGLYVVGMVNKSNSMTSNPEKFVLGNELFTLTSVENYKLYNGVLRLSITAKLITNYNDGLFEFSDFDGYSYMYLFLKFGDKYWNGEEWVDSFTTFHVNFTGGKGKRYNSNREGIYIPITSNMAGNISVGIFGATNHLDRAVQKFDAHDVFITDLQIEHTFDLIGYKSSRSSNKYFRLLGTNFRNEVSISTDLATTLNNTPSPSLILGHTLEPIKEITYYKDNGSDIAGATTEKRRPEIDLLNRLARYYQKARRKLNLIVRYAGTIPPKDRLVLRNDNKEYRPMAESCDWKSDTSDITFMEIPN